MKVTRITKIRGHRIFRAFAWPEPLLAFSQFNVVYGWNGSGKTTLSSLFAHLERRAPVAEGEVDFEIDGIKVSGQSLGHATLPLVRVFNRDFITSTVVASTGTMDPIFYLGEDSAEKQKRAESLKKQLTAAEAKVADAKAKKAAADKALDDFCITNAKLIKELLVSSRTPGYNNYDKRRVRQALEKLTDTSCQADILSAQQKESLQQQKEGQQKEAIPAFAVSLPVFAALERQTDALLKRSVVSQVIDALATDPKLGAWVQQGLALHSGDHETTCKFCDQPLPVSRTEALQAHFNDAFSQFQTDLEKMKRLLQDHQTAVDTLVFPEPMRLYEHLQAGLEQANANAKAKVRPASVFLGGLIAAIRRKRESPFEDASENLQGLVQPNADDITTSLAAVTEVVEQHNAISGQFLTEVEKACQALERHHVADGFPDYCALKKAAKDAEDALKAVADTPVQLQKDIENVEREIVEHRRPAEELNAELNAYLGHEELHLNVKDTGYTMTRAGKPATNLSEGERTAIAFLYFLKSLKDKSTDLSKCVIVIDDPVSSLDANALFSAFGYMKNGCEHAGQLFIFTHNFSFFRQVRNWFHHLSGQRKKDPNARPARFYSLQACVSGGQRSSALGAIDPLLEQYESEYHFLFKRVYHEANQPHATVSLEQYYGMPNIARRLLESFLAFRHPAQSGDLWKRMGQVQWDAAKKTRILRFVHTHSHSNSIADPEHDPSILLETKSILCDLLALIAAVDPEHHQGMMTLVCPADQDADSD